VLNREVSDLPRFNYWSNITAKFLNQIPNRISMFQIESVYFIGSPNMFNSRFKSQSWFGFAHHWSVYSTGCFKKIVPPKDFLVKSFCMKLYEFVEKRLNRSENIPRVFGRATFLKHPVYLSGTCSSIWLLFYTGFRKKHRLLLSCITIRRIDRLRWKLQTIITDGIMRLRSENNLSVRQVLGVKCKHLTEKVTLCSEKNIDFCCLA